MSYDPIDYWRECIEVALAEAGVSATREQIEEIAYVVQGGAENIGQAFHTPENPMIRENEELRKKLRSESEKVGCAECRGSGRLNYMSGPWHVDTQCDRCNGEGKHKP